ncbi:hypothetical protein ACLOJK_014940 [Asimina triloba]
MKGLNSVHRHQESIGRWRHFLMVLEMKMVFRPMSCVDAAGPVFRSPSRALLCSLDKENGDRRSEIGNQQLSYIRPT